MHIWCFVLFFSSVYGHLLKQHLRVCNAREPLHLPYYSKNYNAGKLNEGENDHDTMLSLKGKSLAQLTDKELTDLINLVLQIEKG